MDYQKFGTSNLFDCRGGDPVIRGEKKFFQLETFLKQVGYQNVSAKLYKGMRHELLNETGKRQLYHDILAFLSKKPYS